MKPIIKLQHGEVETAEKVRTRSKARERLMELILERPIERLSILHTVSPDVEAFRDQMLAKRPGSRSGGGHDRIGGRLRRSAPGPGLRGSGDPLPRVGRRQPSPRTWPARASPATTAMGGTRPVHKAARPAAARATSIGPWRALLATGVIRAASRIPTTAAFVPRERRSDPRRAAQPIPERQRAPDQQE